MSYNISDWTTKRLEELIIPLAALYDLDDDLTRRGFRPTPPKIIGMEKGIHIQISDMAIQAKGKLVSENSIAVEEITVWGEGSGTFFSEVFMPALEKSTGRLEAVLVWEGGDSISRLVCDNGKVTESVIEL